MTMYTREMSLSVLVLTGLHHLACALLRRGTDVVTASLTVALRAHRPKCITRHACGGAVRPRGIELDCISRRVNCIDVRWPAHMRHYIQCQKLVEMKNESFKQILSDGKQVLVNILPVP